MGGMTTGWVGVYLVVFGDVWVEMGVALGRKIGGVCELVRRPQSELKYCLRIENGSPSQE